MSDRLHLVFQNAEARWTQNRVRLPIGALDNDENAERTLHVRFCLVDAHYDRLENSETRFVETVGGGGDSGN